MHIQLVIHVRSISSSELQSYVLEKFEIKLASKLVSLSSQIIKNQARETYFDRITSEENI